MHYTVRDGLPGNLVYCGLQDQRGLLWFGTDKGLACFDGTRFHVYGVADGLPDPEVLGIQEDRKGRIWLSCFRKKPCYILNGRIFTEKNDSLLAQIDFDTGTYLISENEEEQGIWFTELSERAYYSEDQTLRAYSFPNAIVSLHRFGPDLIILGKFNIMRLLPNGQVEEICRLPDLIQGLYSRKLPSIVYNTNGRADTVQTVCFQSVAVSGNRILYTYCNRTFLLEYSQGQIRVLDIQSNLNGPISVDRSGRFWICSQVAGAVSFVHGNRNIRYPTAYLPDKKLHWVFEDKQGTLWFCTTNDGIYALYKQAPVIYRAQAQMQSLNIRSIAKSPEGQILAGDDAGFVHVIENGKYLKSITTGAMDGYNFVRQILPENQHQFWVVSDDGVGLYKADGPLPPDYWVTNSMKAITLLRDTVWYASASNVGFLVKSNLEHHNVEGVRTTAIFTDHENMIWLGKVDGLYSRQDNFAFNWGDRFPALKNRIIAIKQARKNELWIVTPESGLLKIRVKAGKILSLEHMNALLDKPIINIQSLYVEPNGRVWMATNKGVYGLDTLGQVVQYSTYDGLADDDVNAVFVSGDTLWAGTVSGLTRMALKVPKHPGQFNTLVVALHYQRFREHVDLRLLDSLPQHRSIVLPPDITNLEFELAGLDFLSRANLRFEVVQTELLPPFWDWTFNNLSHWVLSGFSGASDTSWHQSASLNLGTYLPPGKYRFRVTAINATGARSPFPDTWTLIKQPYWYETVWLYLTLWCLLGYGFWRMYRARIAYREINAAASVLQLQALQAQMNPHFIGNAINAIQQFLHPPDPERTSEYIAVFMRLLRRTMHFSEKTFVAFADELSYNREYLQLIHLRFEDRFQYTITGAEHIPPDTPVPSMILQPVLENATLHGIAPEGQSVLHLEFKVEGDHFRCVLTDNGIGLKETQRQKRLAGIERESKGLHMLQKKISTLNRLYDLDLSLEVQDLADLQLPQSGTRVVLRYCLSKIWKATEKHPSPPAPNPSAFGF